MEKNQEVLTMKEAAIILRISRKKLENLIKNGQIKAINFNPNGTYKKWRILKDDLVQFLQKNTNVNF